MEQVDIKLVQLVLTVPKLAAFTRETKATARTLHVAFKHAEEGFRSRANTTTWRRLVKASRQLHALKRQKDKPQGGGTPTKPATPPRNRGEWLGERRKNWLSKEKE
jgi:hypothetical protein